MTTAKTQSPTMFAKDERTRLPDTNQSRRTQPAEMQDGTLDDLINDLNNLIKDRDPDYVRLVLKRCRVWLMAMRGDDI